MPGYCLRPQHSIMCHLEGRKRLLPLCQLAFGVRQALCQRTERLGMSAARRRLLLGSSAQGILRINPQQLAARSS